MKIMSDIKEWRLIRQQLLNQASLGFVPTMGNLHPGHMSLCSTSLAENDFTAVSIFVNPTQFNHRGDFLHYPKTMEEDIGLLREKKIDFCLIPDEQSIYPHGHLFNIQESDISTKLEGLHRPGHFSGVLTVVMKWLNIIKPHHAYFGEKDYQQYRLIKNMADDFFLDVNIKSCPTVREVSGLAYSSRNNRLTPEQKQIAEQFAAIFLKKAPLGDTLAALHQLNLAVEYVKDDDNRRFAAVKIGDVRLIDNIALP